MSETTGTTIRRLIETDGIKYEVYISRPDKTPALFYLEEGDFISLVEAMKKALGYANREEVKSNE
ncbi:hypothetical protein [Leptospira alexanderi]|uniref:hypothetical protein n=1 Tax=Leptospira alexanderi TaxID=100053 RepID=UPI0009914705|nr:hypothetical protein [Leptospira alexanderi]